jgi:hypothetical protein
VYCCIAYDGSTTNELHSFNAGEAEVDEPSEDRGEGPSEAREGGPKEKRKWDTWKEVGQRLRGKLKGK